MRRRSASEHQQKNMIMISRAVLSHSFAKMFDILHIKGNAKAAIEAALKERGEQGQQNPREPRETKGEDIFERMQHTELAMRGPRFWKKNYVPPNNH